MSKLYFTSSYIDNKIFTDLEDLFLFFHPSEIQLIFDTNVVIEYRQYYFNPTQFTKKDRKEYLKSLRNLFKKIEQHDLEVNASFGVEESCRELYDFSINKEKLDQTHHVLKQMLQSGITAFDNHLTTRYYFGEEVKLKSEYPSSKLNCLNQKSTFQHLLILSYLTLLKIIELFYSIQEGKIEKLDAYKEVHDFMLKNLNVYSGMHDHYALYLFGGAIGYKDIWKKKNGKTNEQKLHNVFNASIDLICPILAGKMQQIYEKKGTKKLIPVFVSGDKILSELHSHRNIKVLYEQNPSLVEMTYAPEGINYHIKREILNWSDYEVEAIGEIRYNSSLIVMSKNRNQSEPNKTALEFLTLVPGAEFKVLNLMTRN